MLMAEGRGLITVVQAVVVSVTLPSLLDAAAVGTGKLSRLALRWGHVGWVRCGHHKGVRGKVRLRSWDRCSVCLFYYLKIISQDNFS